VRSFWRFRLPGRVTFRPARWHLFDVLELLHGKQNVTLVVLAIGLLIGARSPALGAGCASGPDDVATTGCLLELGDAPLKSTLFPGLSNGLVDPAAVLKAAGTGVASRTWSAPDPREPGIIEHHTAISGSLVDVKGTHRGEPPYELIELSVRDPKVALPCGLRIGQPLRAFVKALPIQVDPERWDPAKEIRLDWSKYESQGSFSSAYHANIFLRLTPTGEVREVRWEYFAD